MSRRHSATRAGWRVAILAAFILALFAVVLLSISVGAVHVPPVDLWSYIVNPGLDGNMRDIIWQIRIPRTITSVLVGACLAVSGVLLQGVMRNPLADPQIIGVSSGAGLFGITVLVVLPQYEHLLTPIAFVGASAAAALVYTLSWRNGVQPNRLILAGVAVSALLGSGISAMMIFYSDRVQGALVFMVGGLAAKSWPHVQTMLPYAIFGLAMASIGARKMNLLMLGDSEARNLGVRVERLRLVMTATATLLAASAVSVAGLLGFVGLIVPHMTRLLVGSDYRLHIPASALLGAAVITLCDTLARILFNPVELPVGIMMGVIGAPFFLYLLRRR